MGEGEEMKRNRGICPLCRKDVAVSFPGQIIQRHKSKLIRLSGAICSASGRTLKSLELTLNDKGRMVMRPVPPRAGKGE